MLQSDEFNFPAGAREIEAYFLFVNYVAVAVCMQRNFPKVFVVVMGEQSRPRRDRAIRTTQQSG
jgi:hypothetical protein